MLDAVRWSEVSVSLASVKSSCTNKGGYLALNLAPNLLKAAMSERFAFAKGVPAPAISTVWAQVKVEALTIAFD